MESGFFEYTCIYWDEDNDKFETVHGVTYAESWSDAMYKIEKYYENIENIFIQGLEPFSVYEFESHPVKFQLTIKENE